MKPFLVGVDGSEPSERALRLALFFAEKTDTPLHLVYAVLPPIVPMETNGAGLAELLAGHRQWADELVRRMAKLVPTGIRVDHTVRDGAPAEVLLELADELDASMLFVGNTGRGVVGRVLIGSTADRVVHAATRPVVVVR